MHDVRSHDGRRSAPNRTRRFASLLGLPLALLALAGQARGQGDDEHAPTHVGPAVAPGEAGTKRFAGPLYRAFDPGLAMRDAAYADQWYRVPGGPGYDATLERVAARLRANGFAEHERLKLRFLELELPRPVWIPLSASLILRVEGSPPAVLQAFSHRADSHRVMLPVNAPSADVEGRPVFSLDAVEPGTILVTGAQITRSILRRAERRGAVAVMSSALHPFTTDPTGAERHKDAILWTKVPVGTKLPVAQISARVQERILAATVGDPNVWLAFSAEIAHGSRRLRTLVAEVVGAKRPRQAVAIASHAQEPGACDNASGVAGLTESACCLARLLQSGEIEWPARTIAFLWGDEFRQTEMWLDEARYEVVAGISADMLGESPAETGAIALLERDKDPGALVTLAPDEHTEWGAGQVLEEDLEPHGLSVIARTAMADVAELVGGWATAENPWEGGSDHDVFIDRGIPGVLVWHFTDFTYHTSLDRMTMLDPEELRRSCAAVLASALGVADARPADLERYRATNELERELRVKAALDAGESANADSWEQWCDGADAWLVALCGGG